MSVTLSAGTGYPYNPADWYWQVAGDIAFVWSSARFQYVSINDGAYSRFLVLGGTLYTVPDQNTLDIVMTSQTLPIYFASGLQIISSGTPAISATYPLDSVSMSTLGSVARDASSGMGLPQALQTYNYKDITGAVHALSSVNLINLYVALRNYIAGTTAAVALLTAKQVGTMPTQPVTIP